MTLRESVRAARSPVAKPSNLCHCGRRESRADEMQEDDWEFQSLSCPFLVILNGALLHGKASLPKRAGVWKLMLIFRRHSDVKVVWYRTTPKVKTLDSEGPVFPSQTGVLYFSSFSQNLKEIYTWLFTFLSAQRVKLYKWKMTEVTLFFFFL